MCFTKVFCQDSLARQNYERGLTFRAHEVNKDERTSLDLIPDRNVKLKGDFILEFDVMLMPANHTFGYIFRIISEKSELIDMTSDTGAGRINMIINGKDIEAVSARCFYDKKDVLNKWIKVCVKVTKTDITFIINGESFVLNNPFDDFSIKKIYFGANKHELFYTSDVPPMSIKDVAIKNKNGKTIRYWDMSQHGTDVVYDRIKQQPATVSNGIWRIDAHAKWTKNLELDINIKHPQIATDSVNQRVFVATKDSMYIFDLKKNEIQSVKTSRGEPYTGGLNYMIYDYGSDRLISYNDKHSDLIIYNIPDSSWSSSSRNNSLLIQHHNRFIDKESNRLVVFGGYGVYKYHSHLLKHQLDSGDWSVHDFKEQVMPRYLSSMAYLGDGQALILGGYGSVTGLQESSPHNVYDLIQIDTRNNTSKKLGELTDFQGHYTFGNSMVSGRHNNKLYTLIYQNDVYKSAINILEIDTVGFKSRILTDSIPYNFQDTESYCDMFLSNDSRLHAIVLQKKGDIFNISTYSRLFPPLSQEDISQTEDTSGHAGFILLLAVTGCVTVAVVLFFYFYKKKKPGKPSRLDTGTEVLVSGQDYALPSVQARSRISLLGGFQALDNNGADITGQFTPIVRQIFLFCLLEHANTGKGVTSERMEELFWYDLNKAKATNNRNVNIRKLRLLLQEVGNVSLQYENGYWQLNIGEGTSCDYADIMKLLQFVDNHENITKPVIKKIINIASSGILLPNLETEWVDKYKSAYSNLLISNLLAAAKHPDIAGDLRLLVRLADVILLHDVIDEDSIRIKCHSLYHLGQKGLSKQCYDKFYSDYQDILNEPPQITYKSIIS